jgi:hypothetical protein
MPKVLMRKEKKIRLADLREKTFSPSRDWRWVLCAFFCWIAFCFAVISPTFFMVLRGDISGLGSEAPQEQVAIDIDNLHTATQFIESRQ